LPELIELVDSHCHLDFDWFDADRNAVIKRALEAGVTRIVAPGINPDSSGKAVVLAEKYEGVYAAVGVHPNTNIEVGQAELGLLRNLSRHPKVVAIGEIGLDYYRDRTPHNRQHANLKAQLQLASEVNLPVILHDRQASPDMLRMLTEWRATAADDLDERPGVLHTFSAGQREAEEALQLGFYLGFSGGLTYKKMRATRAVASNAPADRILVETDAPFLTPFPARKTTNRNEPAYVRHMAEWLAHVRGIPVETIAEQTTANAIRLFNLPE
jgi:TatD DNase family protein